MQLTPSVRIKWQLTWIGDWNLTVNGKYFGAIVKLCPGVYCTFESKERVIHSSMSAAAHYLVSVVTASKND